MSHKDCDGESMESIMADIANFDTTITKNQSEIPLKTEEVESESTGSSVRDILKKSALWQGSPLKEEEKSETGISDKPQSSEASISPIAVLNSSPLKEEEKGKTGMSDKPQSNEASAAPVAGLNSSPLKEEEISEPGTSDKPQSKEASLSPVVVLTRLTPGMIKSSQKNNPKGKNSMEKCKVFNEGDSISDASVSDSDTSEFLKGNDILSFLTGSISSSQPIKSSNKQKVLPSKKQKQSKPVNVKASKSSENQKKIDVASNSIKKEPVASKRKILDSQPCEKKIDSTNSKLDVGKQKTSDVVKVFSPKQKVSEKVEILSPKQKVSEKVLTPKQKVSEKVLTPKQKVAEKVLTPKQKVTEKVEISSKKNVSDATKDLKNPLKDTPSKFQSSISIIRNKLCQ